MVYSSLVDSSRFESHTRAGVLGYNGIRATFSSRCRHNNLPETLLTEKCQGIYLFVIVGMEDDNLLAGCSCVGNVDPLSFRGQTDRQTHRDRQTLYTTCSRNR